MVEVAYRQWSKYIPPNIAPNRNAGSTVEANQNNVKLHRRPPNNRLSAICLKFIARMHGFYGMSQLPPYFLHVTSYIERLSHVRCIWVVYGNSTKVI